MRSLFRISRVRIRWAEPGERSSPGRSASLSQARLPGHSASPLTVNARTLHTFDLPNMRVRIRWLGLGSTRYGNILALAVLAAFVWLGLFVATGFPGVPGAPTTQAESVDPAGLEVVELNLAGEAIRVAHSPLDIGQPQDAFDSDLETLIRGREANPFVLDFEFSEPQVVRGITLDFGRMDFLLRVAVYGSGETSPVIYAQEFRDQPAIPHADLSFVNGPEQVRRIAIEIEQLNPPDEVHIHIREVVFKE